MLWEDYSFQVRESVRGVFPEEVTKKINFKGEKGLTRYNYKKDIL